MRALYVDAFSGICGNMFIGALLDLGVPEAHLRKELAKLSLPGYKLKINKVVKSGISATHAEVLLSEEHDGVHRHLSDIITIIDRSSLELKNKQMAIGVFHTLAEAEAKVHNMPVEEVHFHEVGAVDTIVDIVGSVIGLRWLDIQKIFVSGVRTGFGFVRCAHGLMPVPAPGTAELLRNIPFYQGDIEKELTTPTGAALLSALAEASDGMPGGFVGEKVGYGAGTYELPIPNVLRLFLGEFTAESRSERTLVLETNIDDMNPQIYNHVIQKLFAAGATDVWITPIIMKKGRPACLLSVLLRGFLLDEITKVVFLETSTLGVRYYYTERVVLERFTKKVSLPYGEVHIKYGKMHGKTVNAAPEFEDCSNLSALTGQPLKLIWQEALQAAAKEE